MFLRQLPPPAQPPACCAPTTSGCRMCNPPTTQLWALTDCNKQSGIRRGLHSTISRCYCFLLLGVFSFLFCFILNYYSTEIRTMKGFTEKVFSCSFSFSVTQFPSWDNLWYHILVYSLRTFYMFTYKSHFTYFYCV